MPDEQLEALPAHAHVYGLHMARGWCGLLPTSVALGLAASLVALSGCGQPPPSNSAPASASPQHVLLLSIDTLRADHLGTYGYDRDTSPFLDSLFARGLVFDRASSAAPWTLPSHASLLTGLHPHRNGAVAGKRGLAKNVETLPEHLAAQGFATASIVSSRFLGERHGLQRGFAHTVVIDERPQPGPPVTAAALDWAEQLGDQPAFLFVHYYDLHSAYDPADAYLAQFAPPYDGIADGTTPQLQKVRTGEITFDEADIAHVRALYDAEIRELDDELARLFAGLEQLPFGENMLVIVTADHGEEFLDHGDVLHGRSMHKELLHVPLALIGEGIDPGRRDELATHVDVVPTVLSLMGLATPAGLDGRDLSEPDPARHFVFGEADHNNETDDTLRMVTDGHFKLILDKSDDSRALYDLRNDPGETNDVAKQHPEVTALFLSHLEAFENSSAIGEATSALSEEDRRALIELGYLEEG